MSADPPAPIRRTQPITTHQPWYAQYFGDAHLHTLAYLTAEQTKQEVDFLLGALAVPAGGDLLDVGCGYGRHALELAARGYRVVGVDLSAAYLDRAAKEAEQRGLNIQFVHVDMRAMAFRSQFDGATCLSSTFGYFEDADHRQTLQCIGEALRPKGRLLVEVLNRDHVVSELPSRVWAQGIGCKIFDEVDFDFRQSRALISRSILFDSGPQETADLSIRLFCLHELCGLLESAGFRVLDVSGDVVTREVFFGSLSKSILISSEKR